MPFRFPATALQSPDMRDLLESVTVGLAAIAFFVGTPLLYVWLDETVFMLLITGAFAAVYAAFVVIAFRD